MARTLDGEASRTATLRAGRSPLQKIGICQLSTSTPGLPDEAAEGHRRTDRRQPLRRRGGDRQRPGPSLSCSTAIAARGTRSARQHRKCVQVGNRTTTPSATAFRRPSRKDTKSSPWNDRDLRVSRQPCPLRRHRHACNTRGQSAAINRSRSPTGFRHCKRRKRQGHQAPCGPYTSGHAARRIHPVIGARLQPLMRNPETFPESGAAGRWNVKPQEPKVASARRTSGTSEGCDRHDSPG